MTENELESNKSQLDPVDALVAGIKIVHKGQEAQGQTPLPTPEIDKYIEKKKKEAEKHP